MKINNGFSGLALLFLTVTTLNASELKPVDQSGPSSNIAWDVPQLNFVKGGDSARGKDLNKKMMCASCHGEKGIGTASNWPSIAGQNANYTYKMLIDYRDKKRSGTATSHLMEKLAKQMTEQEMADVSAYYAGLPLPPAARLKIATKDEVDKILPLLTKGDGKRLLAPCLSCHGTKAEGKRMDIPSLAGQRAEYFRKTMKEFKSGVRHNDIYARMRHISKALTDSEIDALARYFAEQKD